MSTELRSKVIACRGAIATERRLLAEVAKLLPRTPDELDPPVRIVVPSRSLRLHLLRRLVESHGAVAGVVVQTLGGLAREIVERAGLRLETRVAGFEILVRRLAGGEPALASQLESLKDGYDVILGAVRDLVDAGYEPDNEQPVLERIDELAPVLHRAERDRVAALVRVAARALEAAEITGAQPRAAGFRRAVGILDARGPVALPSRHVIIHGFADLTGIAADLLTAVMRTVGAMALIDRVPEPTSPDRDDPGNAYLDRLELRLGGFDGEVDGVAPTPATVCFTEAPDPEAEARRLAERARSLMSSGTAPEAVAFVARDLGSLGPALRRQLLRLGVPFSGIDARVAGGMLRRKARRLADLLRRGADAELDLWLETAVGLDDVELSLGLRVLSLGRLRDLADVGSRPVRDVPLPIAADGSATRLAASRVAAAAATAGAVLDVLASWPRREPVADHLAATRRLLTALGWQTGTGWAAEVMAEIESLGDEIPPELEIERAEWIAALTARLDGLGEVAIGGAGGGIQILSVTEARGRTFDHLFLCGLNRGVFPRLAVDDPMMPDAARHRLESDVLSEIPVKARSADEERYLFAQLVSSAPRVELSWHLRADGRRMAPSQFVERSRAGFGIAEVERAPALWARREEPEGARPAYEHAVLSAAADAEGLALALAEGRRAAPNAEWSVPADRLARARWAAVAAAERDDGTAPGPWSGFVGPAAAPEERIWVTHLEAAGTCPWRAFLERRLGIRPLPDPHLAVPDPDNRLLGEVVHKVLERIVDDSPGYARSAYLEALGRSPRVVVWPSRERLENLTADTARRVVFTEGLGGFGLARLLTARALPVLEVAAAVEWHGATQRTDVLAAEVEGEIRVASGRSVAFRADRLDAGPAATDYKTGRPLSSAKTETTREQHLLSRIAAGRLLQAAAYALAGPEGAAAGRYLALRPDIGDLPDEVRETRVVAGDREVATAFHAAVGTIERALDAGVAFPRVDEAGGKKADHCAWCGVAEACRRDDTVFRKRLVELMEGVDGPAGEELEAARALWWLGTEREDGT